MELKFLTVSDLNSKAKATIHLSGKLGFNSEAAEMMKLDQTTGFKIAIDGDIENYKHIYLQPTNEADENTVKLLKSGSYYSLPLASLFDRLNINYTDWKVIFDVTTERYQEKEIFRLKRRPKDIPRSSSKNEDED